MGAPASRRQPGPIWRALAWLLLAAALTGCVDVDTVVRVRGDGSGTVTERVLVSSTLFAPLRALTEGLGGDPAFSLLDEEALAARAQAMGEGVQMVDATKRRTGDAEGYLVRYAFPDVRRLRINQNPGHAAPPAGDSAVRHLTARELITFDFTAGDVAELTVHFPRAGAGGAAGEDDPTGPPPVSADGGTERARLETLFRGLRVAVAVEVYGTIVATDATYRDGPRVTLMELDFEELLKAPGHLDRLTERRPRTLEEAKSLLEDVPGLKVELAPEVRIRFRGYGLRVI